MSQTTSIDTGGLSPSLSPICLARKPLQGTVAANLLKWGVGAINIDGCRVEGPKGWCDSKQYNPSNLVGGASDYPICTGKQCYSPVACGGWGYCRERNIDGSPSPEQAEEWKRLDSPHRRYQDNSQNPSKHLGRWPANLIHDGSEEVLACFPESKDGIAVQRNRDGEVHNEIYGAYRKPAVGDVGYGSGGSAARFFYQAKADADTRLGSKHPTVKPLDLIQYLCRLVCPPAGTVLDIFAGTGTTGEAAWREGFNAILIEREAEYVADIERRMKLCLAGPGERQREIATVRPKPRSDANDFWERS